MPIYEYLCQSCSFKFELKQGIKEDPVATCTRCGKPVNRIISPPAIMFKGTGWYITDYSDKLKAPAGESQDSASGPKSDTASGTGSSTPTPATTSASSAPSATSSSAGASPKSG